MTLELLRPWMVLFLPLPLLAWRLLPPYPPRGAVALPGGVWRHFEALSGTGAHRIPPEYVTWLLRWLGWVALVVALAGPVRLGTEMVRVSGRDIIVAVDVSASMGAALGPGGAEDARRLDLVRTALGRVLEERSGDRLGLVAFGDEAHLVAPLSFDGSALAQMLEELDIGLAGRRTDLGQAIGLALKTLRAGAASERSVLLVTDGEANSGALTARDAAAIAARDEVQLNLVAVAEVPDPSRVAQLEAIASATGGSVFLARNAAELAQAAETLAIGRATQLRQAEDVIRQVDMSWIPLLVAFGALVGLAAPTAYGTRTA